MALFEEPILLEGRRRITLDSFCPSKQLSRFSTLLHCILNIVVYYDSVLAFRRRNAYKVAR